MRPKRRWAGFALAPSPATPPHVRSRGTRCWEREKVGRGWWPVGGVLMSWIGTTSLEVYYWRVQSGARSLTKKRALRPGEQALLGGIRGSAEILR